MTLWTNDQCGAKYADASRDLSRPVSVIRTREARSPFALLARILKGLPAKKPEVSQRELGSLVDVGRCEAEADRCG